jgi:hypothetical protein
MPSKRLRPLSRDESFQALKRIRCFKEVHERILAGWSMPELARFIQDDRSEYQHASKMALIQTLQRYRDSIPPAQMMRRAMPDEFAKAKEAVDKGLNVLEEHRKLFKLQMDRIAIGQKNEKNIGMLMPTMTQEVRVASELLTRISDLEMDLGLVTRVGDEVNVNVSVSGQVDVGKYGKKSVADVMNDPERRRKVLNVAQTMLALAGRIDKATKSEVIDTTSVETPTSTGSKSQEELDEEAELAALQAIAAQQAENDDADVIDAEFEESKDQKNADDDGDPLK